MQYTWTSPPLTGWLGWAFAACLSTTLSVAVPGPPRHEANDETPVRPRALDILERAFQRSDPESLRTLLRGEEKLLINSPSLGLPRGYYSPDQVYFLMRDLFQIRTTYRFRLLPDQEISSGGQRLTVVGQWIYRHQAARESQVRMTITLIRRGDHWDLREIRDIH